MSTTRLAWRRSIDDLVWQQLIRTPILFAYGYGSRSAQRQEDRSPSAGDGGGGGGGSRQGKGRESTCTWARARSTTAWRPWVMPAYLYHLLQRCAWPTAHRCTCTHGGIMGDDGWWFNSANTGKRTHAHTRARPCRPPWQTGDDLAGPASGAGWRGVGGGLDR
jgi:hypothetical protein